MGKTTNMNTGRSTSPVMIIIAVLLVASLVANGFLFWQYNNQQEELAEAHQTIELFKSDPQAAEQASVQEYIDLVGQVYDLPQEETPSVATIRDKDLLDDQPFFDRAENGDILMIYAEAELVILYRPSTNRIISTTNITIDDQSEALDTQDTDGTSSGPRTNEE